MNAITAALREGLQAWAPPPRLTVSQWADRERVLPRGTGPAAGRWRTAFQPYLRGIMDAVHERADAIVVQKSARVGATEVLLNFLGYFIAYDPGQALLVEPSEAMAKRLSKHRVGPMLRDTPALARLVAPARGRSSATTLLHKLYPGGALVLAGANSPTALSSDAMRIVLLDEADKYKDYLGDEGDPISLAFRRAEGFWNAVRVIVSTPTYRGRSNVEKWFQQSDQRRFFVPCPRCGREDYFTWNDPAHFALRFDGHDPATARLVCAHCGGVVTDRERRAVVAAGAWRATAPFRGVIGFHVWAAYSALTTFRQIVAQHNRALALGREEMIEFVNQVRGETFEDAATYVATTGLLRRLEAYPMREGELAVPRGVLFLVAGVDTQDDRLEVRVWGFGLGEEAWLLDVRTLPGDPARPEVWQMLDDLLDRRWPHELGHAPAIAAMAIDSAGHRTDHVYDYVRRNQHRHVYCTIGRAGQRAIWTPARAPRPGPGRRPVPLSIVGVDNAKALIVARLLLEVRGPGYVHLPVNHPAVDEAELDQLTSEEYDPRRNVWRLRRAGAANHGLDCFVLALWALRALRPDLRVAAERLVQPASPPATSAAPEPPAPAAPAEPDTSTPPPSPPAARAPVVPPTGRRMSRSSYLARGW